MKTNRLLMSLCVVLMTAGMAATAVAQPILTVTHDAPGPIACGTEVTFTVHYDPNDYTGELLAYEMTASVDGTVLTLNPDGATILWPNEFFAPIYDGDQVTIGTTALDPANYLTGPADLFTVTCTSEATGDAAELMLSDVTLRDINGDAIPGWTMTGDTVDVDCSAPGVPVLDPEPEYTAGTSNEVSWGAVVDVGADGTEAYHVQAATDDAFTAIVDEYTGLTGTSQIFAGLASPQEYFYRVRAIDGLGNASDWSATESSIQDDSSPTSYIDVAGPGSSATGVFDVPWVAEDPAPGSGVAHVELWYSIDGVGENRFNLIWETSPIPFERPAGSPDGEYLFWTRAVDNAGNTETEAEQAIGTWLVTIDSTPPDVPELDPEPDFTQGTENTVSWAAVSDAVEYRVTCVGVGEQVVSGTEATFGPLDDGVTYEYHVSAIDALANESGNSASEFSTQDANPPLAMINDADNESTITTSLVEMDVEFEDRTIADDADGSGVTGIRLYYSANGGSFTFAGETAVSDPSPVTIGYTVPEDGEYVFYTRAVDAVGNVEPVPAGIEFTITVDTTVPAGVFVVNGDDDYTTSEIVELSNTDFPDDVEKMWFTNSESATPPPAGDPAWLDFAATQAWTLDLTQGEQTVYAYYLDSATNMFDTQDSIILDTIAPAAPTGFSAAAGHETITLEWTNPSDEDIEVVEIWASLWDDVMDGAVDSVGSSAYPEFNDIAWPDNGGAVSGYADVAVLDADADWFLLAEVAVAPDGEVVFVHDADSHPDGLDWSRAAYSYYLFERDAAGNYSQSTRWTKRTINYILGDFRPDGAQDGIIDLVDDVTYFAMGYGETALDGAGDPNPDFMPELDISLRYINSSGDEAVGPVPWTDDEIEFFDLLQLALNFPLYQAKAAVGAPETPLLAWYEVDENAWALGLTEECNSLKAVRVRANLPEDVTVGVAAHDNLDDVTHLLLNDDARGLDLGFAVLGENAVMPGSGEIFRITTSQPIDLSDADITVRDATGNVIEFVMSSEPIEELPEVYSVGNNYPNPFNPQTTIQFALPEAQDVRIDIFDIRGYRLRTLVDESMPAGHHSVIWNGRDGAGRQVASGAYFYRVQAGPMSETRRMLLVK
ncbi:hypothetical protein GF314_04040 [bacterium]|nr:hypothetical protein [bacterium]